MAATSREVHHRDGVIRIAENTLALCVHCKLLARQRVLSRANAVCAEIGGGADIRPIDITSCAQFAKRLRHRRCERLVAVGEVRGVGKAGRVALVKIEASRAAYDQQTSFRSCEDIAEVCQSRGVLAKGIWRLSTEGINNHVESSQIVLPKVHKVF